MSRSGHVLATSGKSAPVPFEDLAPKEQSRLSKKMKTAFWNSPPKENSEEYWKYFMRGWKNKDNSQVDSNLPNLPCPHVTEAHLIFDDLTPMPGEGFNISETSEAGEEDFCGSSCLLEERLLIPQVSIYYTIQHSMHQNAFLFR